LLTEELTTPVALFVARIDTPGSIAPEESETVPVSVALFTCAYAEAVSANNKSTHDKVFFIVFSREN
jgi:hypothetical protein